MEWISIKNNNHLGLSCCLYLCTPPHLCLCCYIILTTTTSLLYSKTKVHPIHLNYNSPSYPPWSISFILLIIVHHFYFYHIWSYSCYTVIQPYFHDILRNTNLLKYLNAWANIETYVSKPTFANITGYFWFCFRNYLLMLTVSHFFHWGWLHRHLHVQSKTKPQQVQLETHFIPYSLHYITKQFYFHI